MTKMLNLPEGKQQNYFIWIIIGYKYCFFLKKKIFFFIYLGSKVESKKPHWEKYLNISKKSFFRMIVFFWSNSM